MNIDHLNDDSVFKKHFVIEYNTFNDLLFNTLTFVLSAFSDLMFIMNTDDYNIDYNNSDILNTDEFNDDSLKTIIYIDAKNDCLTVDIVTSLHFNLRSPNTLSRCSC